MYVWMLAHEKFSHSHHQQIIQNIWFAFPTGTRGDLVILSKKMWGEVERRDGERDSRRGTAFDQQEILPTLWQPKLTLLKHTFLSISSCCSQSPWICPLLSNSSVHSDLQNIESAFEPAFVLCLCLCCLSYDSKLLRLCENTLHGSKFSTFKRSSFCYPAKKSALEPWNHFQFGFSNLAILNQCGSRHRPAEAVVRPNT